MTIDKHSHVRGIVKSHLISLHLGSEFTIKIDDKPMHKMQDVFDILETNDD